MSDVTVNTQSSIRIAGERIVYCDPLEISGAPRDADIVLITHSHDDHFSPKDIARVAGSSTVFVVPAAMVEAVTALGIGEESIVPLRPGETVTVYGVDIDGIAAYNRMKPFHPRENGWLGYIVTIGGQRLYIAGDTDVTDDNRAIACDIAFVPVGGTFTMDAAEAAALVSAIHPRIAVPTHYGSIVGNPDDGQIFRSLVESGISVKLPLG